MDHERLLLWPAFGVKARSDRAFWWVRSSDDDEWVEDISGNDPQNGPSVSASGTWTRRMARRSSPLLIPITCRVAQLGDLYQTGTTNSVNSGVPRFDPRHVHDERRRAEALFSHNRCCWAEPISGVAVGSQLEQAHADIRAQGSVALIRLGRNWVRAERMPCDLAAEWA